MSNVARAFSRMAAPLHRMARLMIGRCVVTLVNDALKMQGVQITLLADETRDNVERMQEYGFTSVPHPGAEALSVSVGGSRNHCVVIKCDDRRYRLTGLEGGEVAIYDDLGTKIVLKRGNVIEATAATRIDLITPLTHASGNLQVDGNAKVNGNIVADGDISDHTNKSMLAMRQVYNTHTHPENDSGGPTSAPNQQQ